MKKRILAFGLADITGRSVAVEYVNDKTAITLRRCLIAKRKSKAALPVNMEEKLCELCNFGKSL